MILVESLSHFYKHLFFLINLTELKFMGSLTAYLYGVFPTQGFPNDTLYPFTYRLGEVVLENIGCLDGDKVYSKAYFLVLLSDLQYTSCS
jgi:hypothetical protein